MARCIYLSTLRLLEDYEENLTVTEKWRSLPPSEDPLLLACHLGEIVCKEFARDSLIDVVTLRLGFPLICGDRQAAVDSGESAAVSIEDVITAVGEGANRGYRTLAGHSRPVAGPAATVPDARCR